jgi:hypothetical protein
LAGGNVNQIDEVVKQPLEKCLLLLSYRADKNMLEDLVHKAHLQRMNNQ